MRSHWSAHCEAAALIWYPLLLGVASTLVLTPLQSGGGSASPKRVYVGAVIERANLSGVIGGYFTATGGASCRGSIYLVLVFTRSDDGQVDESEVRVQPKPQGDYAVWSARVPVPQTASPGPAVLYAATSCGREEQSADVAVTIRRAGEPVTQEEGAVVPIPQAVSSIDTSVSSGPTTPASSSTSSPSLPREEVPTSTSPWYLMLLAPVLAGALARRRRGTLRARRHEQLARRQQWSVSEQRKE